MQVIILFVSLLVAVSHAVPRVILNVPYTSTGRIYDWEPVNCQYNGVNRPAPRGPGSPCNETYYLQTASPDGTNGLRMRQFADDLSKDSTDLAEGSFKCPVTALSTACNHIGMCTDVFPVNMQVVARLEMMLSLYHLGYNTCFMIIKGPSLAICIYDGKYVLMNYNIGSQPLSTVIAAFPYQPVSMHDDLNIWHSWKIEMLMDDASGSGTCGPNSYFRIYKDDVLQLDYNMPGHKTGAVRRFQFGSVTMHLNCATADIELFMRNIVAVESAVLTDADLQSILSVPTTTPQPRYMGATQTLSAAQAELDLYKVWDVLPTQEDAAAARKSFSESSTTTEVPTEIPATTTSANVPDVKLFAQVSSSVTNQMTVTLAAGAVGIAIVYAKFLRA